MTYANLAALSAENFKRYTGVSRDTFGLMLDLLEQRESSKIKSGRPNTLCLEDQLLMTLTYLREYRSQFHLGVDFGVSDATACKIICSVEDHLVKSGCFGLPQRVPDNAANVEDWNVVVIDATETPIERPIENSTAYYSGKKNSIR